MRDMLARRCMGRGFTSRYSRSLRFANATLVRPLTLISLPHGSAQLSPKSPPPCSWSRRCCTGTMRRACSGPCRCQREDASERSRGRADPPAPWAGRVSASPLPWGANARAVRVASRPRSCRHREAAEAGMFTGLRVVIWWGVGVGGIVGR